MIYLNIIMTQDLSELIKLNKRIVSQNNKLINQNIEIIELLKRIANDESVEEDTEIFSIEEITFVDKNPAIGEVHFIEDENIFRLSVNNGKTVIDNLTGDAEAGDFTLQEEVARKSAEDKRAIPSSTVILSKKQAENLPTALKICIEYEFETVFIPFYSSTQLIGAPDELRTLINIELYKDSEDLIAKMFN